MVATNQIHCYHHQQGIMQFYWRLWGQNDEIIVSILFCPWSISSCFAIFYLAWISREDRQCVCVLEREREREWTAVLRVWALASVRRSTCCCWSSSNCLPFELDRFFCYCFLFRVDPAHRELRVNLARVYLYYSLPLTAQYFRLVLFDQWTLRRFMALGTISSFTKIFLTVQTRDYFDLNISSSHAMSYLLPPSYLGSCNRKWDQFC